MPQNQLLRKIFRLECLNFFFSYQAGLPLLRYIGCESAIDIPNLNDTAIKLDSLVSFLRTHDQKLEIPPYDK